MVRHVLRRMKPVRMREEQELQSCHGVDQRVSAGKPDRELAVERGVLAGVAGWSSCFGVKAGASAWGGAELGRSTLVWAWASVWGGLHRRRRVLLPCGVTGASVVALL